MSKIHLKYDSASALTNNQVVKYSTTESGATASMIYDNGTNVGVGTANPTSFFTIDAGSGSTKHLLVKSTGIDTGIIIDSGEYPSFSMRSAGNTSFALQGVGTSTILFRPTSFVGWRDYTNGDIAGMVGMEGPGNYSFFRHNVIIGSGSPSGKLTVRGEGTGYTTSSLVLANSASTTVYDFTDKGRFRMYDPTGTYTLTLEVEGTSGVAEILTTKGTLVFSTANGEYALGRTTAGGVLMYTNGKQLNLSATVGGAPNVSIDTSGKLGVGITSPTALLDVKGVDDTSSNYSLKVQNSASTEILSVRNDGFTNLYGNFLVGRPKTSTPNVLEPYSTGFGGGALVSNTTGSENTAIGFVSLYSNTSGTRNTAIGMSTMFANQIGNGNVAIGAAALQYLTGGSVNVGIGWQALQNNAAGSGNIGIGYRSLISNTSGNNNIAIGSDGSLYNNNGEYNVALGYYTGFLNSGSRNIFLGTFAGSVTTGMSDTLIIDSSTSGRNYPGASDYGNALIVGKFASLPENQYLSINANVGIGATGETATAKLHVKTTGNTTGYGLKIVDSGSTNIISAREDGKVLIQTLTAGLGGSNVATNTAFGVSALNVGGLYGNTAIGYEALKLNQSNGYENTAVGYNTLATNTTGRWNTGVGSNALGNSVGERNTGVGAGAAGGLNTNGYNTAIGYTSLVQSTGGSNTSVGAQAMYANVTGENNVAIGLSALGSGNISGSNNCAIGYEALYSNDSSTNIGIGYRSYYSNTVGYNNVSIGYNSGWRITSGSSNTIIGNNGSGNQTLTDNVTGQALDPTMSNNIIISDGDGTIRYQSDSSGNSKFNGDGVGLTLPRTSFTSANVVTTGGTFSADTYYYKITVLNSLGETIPGSVQTVSISVSGSSVDLGWTPIVGATSYRIYRRPNSDLNNWVFYSVTGNSYTDTNAAPDGVSAPPVQTTAYSNRMTNTYFMPPRLTTVERDAITPLAGMMIYNLTTNKHQGYNGSTWNDFYA